MGEGLEEECKIWLKGWRREQKCGCRPRGVNKNMVEGMEEGEIPVAVEVERDWRSSCQESDTWTTIKKPLFSIVHPVFLLRLQNNWFTVNIAFNTTLKLSESLRNTGPVGNFPRY